MGPCWVRLRSHPNDVKRGLVGRSMDARTAEEQLRAAIPATYYGAPRRCEPNYARLKLDKAFSSANARPGRAGVRPGPPPDSPLCAQWQEGWQLFWEVPSWLFFFQIRASSLAHDGWAARPADPNARNSDCREPPVARRKTKTNSRLD